jgi:hypothetical protein
VFYTKIIELQNYKPPGVKDIPLDFRIYLRKKAPNPFGVLRSKGNIHMLLYMQGAVKSLAFPIYFPICSTTKRIFLGWVKEVRTTKS